jgi:hypothetical protein
MKLKNNPYLFFRHAKNQHNLRLFTFIAFLFLVIEKILSGATATYVGKNLVFHFTLLPIDIICIIIYLSVAILLEAKVKYRYLLIPDFFLLFIKLYTATSSLTHLLSEELIKTDRLIYLSKLSESLLFSMFLIFLFVGKLTHHSKRYAKNYPFVCMRLLIACFPVTIIFEILKTFSRIEMHTSGFLIVLSVCENILNEAFLDLPYFLLLLLMAFVPENKY